ncbi:MAG: DEAD/DEAH box helicase, partial [Candidatus Methanomethylicaceae archaeon]
MAQSPIEFCCSEIIRYLRDRKHPEAPHISTLSPDFSIKEILKKSLRICQSTLISDEDEEDEMPEDLDRIRGNSTFGVEADFSSLDDTGKVKFSCSFCFRQRIKARSEENADGHGEFSRVNLEAVLDGLKTLKLTIQVADEEGRVFNSTSKTLPVEVNKTYRVGFGNQFALKAILGSKDLKPHTSTSTTIDETWLIQALSVNTAGALTKCENLKGEYCNMQELKPIVTFLFEFAITSRGDLNRLRFNLRHIGCIHDSNGEVLYVNYISDPVDPFSTRSSVKQLFEISGLLSWEGVEPKWEKTEYGLKGIMPIGGMLIERGNQEVAIQDWIIAREAIEKIRLSEKKLKEALTSISKCANIRPDAPEILSNAIAMAFAQRLERLYTYQECATSEILSLLTKENYGSRSVDVVVIQARTAGGKTYAFLLPIFLYLINSKLMGGRKGVEFILLYPTVALANDQADEILKFLYFVNLQLYGKEISLGILNQYIESRYPKGEYQASGVGLRLGCPLCGALLELLFEEKAGEKGRFRLERAT